LPHDSCSVKANKCFAYSTAENDLGIQTKLAWPSKNPFSEKSSKSNVRVFKISTGTTPPRGPPICIALILSLKPPPISSIIKLIGVPKSTS